MANKSQKKNQASKPVESPKGSTTDASEANEYATFQQPISEEDIRNAQEEGELEKLMGDRHSHHIDF
jgi:hypothetical protein